LCVCVCVCVCEKCELSQKKKDFFNWIILQWPLFGKRTSNTWFVGSTRINKIYLSYLQPSFDLWIYSIHILFQYIIILWITFNLNIWIDKIYPDKIFITGS